MKCNYCGFENKDDSPFCYNCGVNLKNDSKTSNKNVEVLNNGSRVEIKRQSHSAPLENSIQAKLMYKHDKHTGQLRVAKTKCATLIVFCAFLGLGLIIYPPMFGIVPAFFVSIIVGIIFALPVAIRGFVIGRIIDKIFH